MNRTAAEVLDQGDATALVPARAIPDGWKVARCADGWRRGHDRILTSWKGAPTYAHAECLLCGGRLRQSTRNLIAEALLVAAPVRDLWRSRANAARRGIAVPALEELHAELELRGPLDFDPPGERGPKVGT
jgi:hypothetical protein